MLVLFIVELLPELLGQMLHQKTLGTRRELGESYDVLGLLKVGSALGLRWSDRATELFLLLDHCLDSIVHVLNELSLASSESPLVGDIIDVVISLGVLSVSTSDLDIEPVGNRLESVLLLTQKGEVDMDRGPQGCP